jgi:hypothetical protein
MKTHIFATASVAALLVILASATFAQDGHGGLSGAVKAANDRFSDPAAATAEGYLPMPCVSGPAGGAMGIHMANPGYIEDGVVDIAKPEAVLYEPQPDGSLQLVAVEYITFTGPAVLNGHLFHFVGAPNRYGLDPFYELHVWAWRENAWGTFADFNPAVSCDAMMDGAGMSH